MIDICLRLRVANTLVFLSCAWVVTAGVDAAEKRPVRLMVEDQSLGSAAKYGLERVTAALAERDYRLDAKAADSDSPALVVGTYGGSERIRGIRRRRQDSVAEEARGIGREAIGRERPVAVGNGGL